MGLAGWIRVALALLGLVAPDWSGAATYYAAAQHAGRPLYCDQHVGVDGSLVYDENDPPWVAVDVGRYESGEVRCGDWLLLVFDDGGWLTARALDAGRLAGTVAAVDLPEHLHPGGGVCGVTVYRIGVEQ
jgi:hypothetical protein